MDGGDDGCHLVEPRVSKKIKKDDNLDLEDGVAHRPPSSHQEIEIEGKNPFQIQVILDVIFKMLSFEEVKKFRLVSSTWNEMGATEIYKRPQKPIKFNRVEEFGQDDKLGALVQLQRIHKEIFPHYHHQLFSYFAFNISPMMMFMEFDQFFDHFSPKCVELFGDCDINNYNEKVRKLFEFYIKLSPTVEELNFNLNDYSRGQSGREEDFVQELTSTPFPNLRKISYNIRYNSDLKDLSIYSLIGKNSPKLQHLELRSINTVTLGSPRYMKEQFERSGLMSKLQILDLFISSDNFDFDGDFLRIFTQFGQIGELKLTKLKLEQNANSLRPEQYKQKFIPLIASQAETLKILEISTFSNIGLNLRLLFPSLQNLSILQIDNFSSFKQYFEPINFALQFPKLVEFKTNDMVTFLAQNLGRGGDSVKSITISKKPEDVKRSKLDRVRSSNYSSQMSYYLKNDLNLNLVLVHQIFPNLEYLEVDIFNLKLLTPFWSQLKKVIIHCEPKDLYKTLCKKILQDAKRVELVVDCGSKLIDEDSYKNIFGRLMINNWMSKEDLDNYSRNKYYQKFLDKISYEYSSLNSVSFTFIGRKISEDFKRDFGAILPHSEFICTPFKSTNDE